MTTPEMELAPFHNAIHATVQAYGHLLAEQERRHAVVTAALRAVQEENKKLREALMAAVANEAKKESADGR